MSVVFEVLALLLLLYLVVMFVRLVLDWIQVFARDWRPTGVVLVVANVAYGLTDPPLRWLRRFIRPVRIGSVQLDLAFLVLFIGVSLLRTLMLPLAL